MGPTQVPGGKKPLVSELHGKKLTGQKKPKECKTGQVSQLLTGWVGVVEVSVSGPCKTDASKLRICFLFASSQEIPVVGTFCFCRLLPLLCGISIVLSVCHNCSC